MNLLNGTVVHPSGHKAREVGTRRRPRSLHLAAHRPALILYNPVIMKAIATVIVLSASLLVHAQTPAPKSAPAKSSPARTGAAHTPPAHAVPAQPGDAQGQGARGLQGDVHHHCGRLRDRGPSRVGAARRRPLLQPGPQRIFHQRGLLSRRSRLRGAIRAERQPAVNKVWDHATIQDDPVIQSNKRGKPGVRHRRPQHAHHPAVYQFGQQPGLDGRALRPSATSTRAWTWCTRSTPAMARRPART